jgi:hypothetical protein
MKDKEMCSPKMPRRRGDGPDLDRSPKEKSDPRRNGLDMIGRGES